MRLIDADALMEIYMDRLSLVADRYSPDSSECGILSGAMKLLDKQPTIEPERKTGEWIPHKSIFGGLGERVYTCDQCGHNIGFHMENYCPNCGADKRGEQDESD